MVHVATRSWSGNIAMQLDRAKSGNTNSAVGSPVSASTETKAVVGELGSPLLLIPKRTADAVAHHSNSARPMVVMVGYGFDSSVRPDRADSISRSVIIVFRVRQCATGSDGGQTEKSVVILSGTTYTVSAALQIYIDPARTRHSYSYKKIGACGLSVERELFCAARCCRERCIPTHVHASKTNADAASRVRPRRQPHDGGNSS